MSNTEREIYIFLNHDLIILTNNEEQSWYEAAVCDLTRLPVGRPVFRGDLLVLAVAGDDKFVLFRGSTLKKRDGTESVTPTSRRAKKKPFKNGAFKLTLAFAPCGLADVSPTPSHRFFFCITSPGFTS